MTDYNDGKWHGWDDGECPVHSDSVVQAVVRRSSDDNTAIVKSSAGSLYWDATCGTSGHYAVCAFRVINEHKEPREFWIWTDKFGAQHALDLPHHKAIHVREVME